LRQILLRRLAASLLLNPSRETKFYSPQLPTRVLQAFHLIDSPAGMDADEFFDHTTANQCFQQE
jgi:hypothetical protein